LKRLGKIRAPYYRIVVADSRTKRDGRVIEEIGKYHPTEEPSVIEIKSDRALYWLGVGAQPTEQVMALLKLTGDWGTFKGEKGATNTVRTAEAKVEFQADEKKKPVLRPKTEKVADVKDAKDAEEKAPAEKSEKAEKAGKAADAVPAEETAPAAEAPAADEPAADEPAADEPAPAEASADDTAADDADKA
jgi:small subunit ribosomal protein S16